MEKKLDGLSNAVMALQNMFVQQGMGKELAVMPSKTKSGKQSKRSDTGENTLNTTSETTIYDNAVGKEKTDTVPSEDDEVTFNFNKQQGSQ